MSQAIDRIGDMELFLPFIERLYGTVLPDDYWILDEISGTSIGPQLLGTIAEVNDLLDKLSTRQHLNLPSVRTAKQFYPIAPRELLDFFLDENIYLLARDIKESSRVENIRAVDVRNYLRHALTPAFRAMLYPTQGAELAPPLADDEFMREVIDAIHQRQFGAVRGRAVPARTA